ncbi:ceramide transfer protein-like isoform X1 [Mercenaria mercenaria]|uniref:ceramide transfer protein-like isoform X1 n=1 Tax=Mercenaria mercenaria TaxID=6596 RepID=UPI001E1DCCED|nr:ceramide transfer protein-like isoform X1 [Mercenaria mercenaria]
MSEDKIDALSITDDEGEDSEEDLRNFEKKGVLSKWTNYLHGWQDRYIVLKDGTLSYYKSENDLAFGCRGAVSLTRASVTPHQFDECRFDVAVNDSVWYLRAESEDERQVWIDVIDNHRQTESGYGSESNLRRHGSLISLTSGTSMSTASTSSFKRGRGLREKLMEMETFRDILCRQIETLQSYFDSCASAVAHGTVNDLTEDDIGDPDDLDHGDVHQQSGVSYPGHSAKDLASILQQHGAHSVDFKGESFTFKATTAGIIATLSHCIELMSQREDAWRKKLEKEVDRRKKYEDAYKTLLEQHNKQQQNASRLAGPDFEEGPHSVIKEDEFFDAIDASLDKLEKEEEDKRLVQTKARPPPKIHLSPENSYYEQINKIVNTHIHQLYEKTMEGKDVWECIAEDGELKVYKRELEVDGVVLDPLKAVHTVTDSIEEVLTRSDTVALRSTSTYEGITGHEVCRHFWDIKYRMDWEATLDSSNVVDWLSDDTFICHNIIKRVWPASQRDALFWTHIRHVQGETDEEPDLWIVVNYSTNLDSIPSNKYVRVTMNVAMVCQTIIEPPVEGEITRDNIKCKISYTAEVNPGGWAPASVLRAVYKREYPKFLKRFTSYVRDATKDKEILF